jgi:inner membrane protein
LGNRTALGATALIVGANLPDLDVLAYLGGPEADLEWRRGWSHGVLALTVLPLVLTGFLLLIHRSSRGLRRSGAAGLVPKQLLLLSFVAILSHPILDTLNTYGMRWLMPFSGRWVYGDTLFIVDPWVWAILGLGVFLSRQRENAGSSAPSRPARLALAVVVLYTGIMALSGRAARAIIAREVVWQSGRPVEAVMAGPAPLDPFVRHFVVEQAREYRVGTFHWLERPHVDRDQVLTFPRGRPAHPAFDAAVATRSARRFLGWARFPTFGIERPSPREFLVHMLDLRYARSPDDGFGTLSIPVSVTSAFARSRASPAPSSAEPQDPRVAPAAPRAP